MEGFFMARWMDYGVCHIGKVRGRNEDNLLMGGKMRDDVSMPIWGHSDVQTIEDTHKVYAVLDGMGGESSGDWASLTGAKFLQSMNSFATEDIYKAFGKINEIICKKMKHENGKRIGSTVVAVSIYDRYVQFLNLGDSRGYLFQNGVLQQISCDHTVWQSKLNMGIPLENLKKGKSGQNTLTQHLGIFSEEMMIEPFVSEKIEMQVGDIVLLCSDGLTGMVRDQEIQCIMAQNFSLEEIGDKLLEMALDVGGKDNITIALMTMV